MASKQELVKFLDEKVFDPVLKASPDKYNGSEKDDLKYVQDRTRTERERYHHYGTAQEVVNMFKDDLHSENAKPVNARLKKLGLPRLEDVRDEFEKKAA
jgi:hypothetical protein